MRPFSARPQERVRLRHADDVAAASCPEAVNVSRAADHVLSPREAAALRAHLSECPECVAWARTVRRQRRAFRVLALEPVPSTSSTEHRKSGSLRRVSIFNRRNAALGWLTWMLGKRVAEMKARSAVRADEGRSKKKLFLGALAAVGAVLFFWRRRDDEPPPPPAA